MTTAHMGRSPGQYWPAIDGEKLTAIFYCPTCGQGMSLINHVVQRNGIVSPSVIEPSEKHIECPNPRCGSFHDHLELIGFAAIAAIKEKKP
jgi:hypothetical protein